MALFHSTRDTGRVAGASTIKDMERLLFVLMLAAGCGFGQGNPAQPKKASAVQRPAGTRWPIQDLVVEGNRIYSTQQILAVAGLKTGQTAGRPEFEAARERLLATGAFETVSYKFAAAGGEKGYVATFQVTEIEQAYPVRFEDLKVSELALTAALKARDPLFSIEKMAATQPVLDRYAKWIQEFMATQGQTEKIVGSVQPATPGDYNIIFRVDRPLPVVALVTFRGNHIIPETALHEAINYAAVGTPYTEDRFRDILNASIRPLYEARGHVRVAFPEIHSEAAPDIKGVRVFVTVDEGESYTLGQLNVSGSPAGRSDALLKEADLKTGDLADYDKINKGAEIIRKATRHGGYLDAKVTANHRVDNGKKAVDVTYFVDPGALYSMGKLSLTGLDLEGEAEIKRIWTLTQGKPFNPDYPDLFLNTIRQEGMFDHLGKTKADVHVDEKRHVADVTLTFSGDAGPQQKPGRRGGRGL
jgi:outer membrane protein insertion porin family